MTRFILVVGAGLLSANAAYAQIPHCKTSCTAITSTLVCYLNTSLKTPYDPTSTDTPTCDTSRSVPKGTIDTINNAFQAGNNTLPGLQKCLCSLKNIFVTEDLNYGSWGKWLNPNRPDVRKSNRQRTGKNKRVNGSDDSYIALDTTDLNTTVHQQQDAHLTALNIAASSFSETESGTSNIPSSTLAVLYALAHEMAHMGFRRDNGSFGSGCTLKDMAVSWKDASNAPNWAKRLWTIFGDASFGQRDPSVLPDPHGATPDNLNTIYTGSVVTALGAANPEEDFVETYAIEAINLATGADVTPTNFTLNINLTIAGKPVTLPVNTNRNNADLQSKFGCVKKLLQ